MSPPPIAQLGLAAYMFIVGLEFRLDIIHRRLKSAVAVSILGMIAPFALGGALGYFFHQHISLLPARTTVIQAVRFLGASM